MKMKHTNPDGTTAMVAGVAVIAQGVHIGPRADIRGGTIHGGTIHGGTIYGGTIYGGTICGGTICGGTIYGGTIYGGTICDGTIYGGTISGCDIRDRRDILTIGPVGVTPSLFIAYVNSDRSGWVVQAGCSDRVELDTEADDDPFSGDYPCEGREAVERLAALQFLRTACKGRGING